MISEPERQMPLIMLVDDDAKLCGMIEMLLTSEGYEVKTAASVFQARGLLAKPPRPDLLILDRSLPDGDGMEILDEVRRRNGEGVPVLFLTANAAPKQKARGLDSGADDYMAKPFAVVELRARVRALLRRGQVPATPPPSWLRAGILAMDLVSHRVVLDGKLVELPKREFELLAAFLQSPGRVLERRFLLERVWGGGAELRMNSKSVDVAVGRLRSALGSWGKNLEAVQNYGYRLNTGD